MNRILIIICIIFSTLPLISQNENKSCVDFKYGKFTFPLLPEGSGYAVRENNYQISFLGNGEKQLYWEVEWIDDCHYNLTLKEIYDDSGHWTVGDKIEVEINSFKKNCYGFKSILNAKTLSEPSIAYDMMCKEEEI